MARFQETVNIQPQSVETGAVQFGMSVDQRLAAFDREVLGLATEAAVERGVSAAKEIKLTRREDGFLKKPKKINAYIGKIENDVFFNALNNRIDDENKVIAKRMKAHQDAAKNAYMSGITNDINQNIGEIEITDSTDINSFNDKVAAYRSAMINNVDPSMRDIVAGKIDAKIVTSRLKVFKNTIERQTEENLIEIESNIDSAGRQAAEQARNGYDIESDGSLLSAFEMIDQALKMEIDPKQKEILLNKKREIEMEVREQKLRGVIDNISDQSIEEGFKAIDKMSKKVPKGWEPDEWDAFISSAQSDLNSKRARLKGMIVETSKELLKEESIERGFLFTGPSIPADPAKGSQDRKDVNNWYEKASDGWSNLPPIEQFDKNVEFVKNTGIMPDKLQSNINATMRSGQPDQVFIMSKFVNSIKKDPNSANILKDLPDESRAMSQQVFDSMEAGIDLDIAVEIGRKNTYGLTEPEKERIAIETQAIRPQMAELLSDEVDKEFDPSIMPNIFGIPEKFGAFLEEPEVNPALQADFNVSFKKFMTLTGGDSTQAAKLAFSSIKKFWGVTRVGGKRFMKFSPELFYSRQGVNNIWMNKQFESDLKSIGFDSKNSTITTDFQTIDEKEPTWPVMSIGEDGIVSPVFDKDGKVMRWKPDFEKTKEFTKHKNAPIKQTKRAKELRDSLKRMSEVSGVKNGELLPIFERRF